jgi:type I restriction enzyme, S subunit
MAVEEADLGTGRTGGREATTGVIPGRVALSVGCPDSEPPKGWKWTSLSNVAQLESGHTPSRKHPEYWDGGIPWIGIKDATENHGRTISDTYQHVSALGLENSSARLLPANTVCLSRTASVGFVVVMGRPMATSQDFVNWVCGPNIDAHYLKYVLLAENEALWRFASGTTHQTIYYPEAKAFHVCLPPIAEQKAIAAVLGALDDKIELNRRMNATLEAMARALFQSWFVDFDPVRSKLDGRSSVALDPATAVLFPDSLQDSSIGPIPQGWGVSKLKELTSKIGSGATPRGGSDVYVDEGPALIRSQNIYDHEFHWAGLARLTDKSAAELKNVEVMQHDVLLNITGDSILRTCVVDPAVLPARVNQHVAIIRAIKGIPPRFLHLYLVQESMKSILIGMSAGATRHAITKGHLESIDVLKPSAQVLASFEQFTTPWFAKIDANRTQSRTLAALRDTLLPKLLSGEVSTSNIRTLTGMSS